MVQWDGGLGQPPRLVSQMTCGTDGPRIARWLLEFSIRRIGGVVDGPPLSLLAAQDGSPWSTRDLAAAVPSSTLSCDGAVNARVRQQDRGTCCWTLFRAGGLEEPTDVALNKLEDHGSREMSILVGRCGGV